MDGNWDSSLSRLTLGALVANPPPHSLCVVWMPPCLCLLLGTLSSTQQAPQILLPLPGSLLGFAIGWQLPWPLCSSLEHISKAVLGHLSPERNGMCSFPHQAFAQALFPARSSPAPSLPQATSLPYPQSLLRGTSSRKPKPTQPHCSCSYPPLGFRRPRFESHHFVQ